MSKETITFGMGCFWCYQPLFADIKGVESVTVGYAGGKIENPSYELISTGSTEHAEVVQIIFDSEVIDFKDLLDVFWHMHNPTTPNRQGNDSGPQYRSMILYSTPEQKLISERNLKEIDNSDLWEDPIITQIEELDVFYPAEEYHQDFYKNNPNQGYCSVIINPKVTKFREKYKSLLKEE